MVPAARLRRNPAFIRLWAGQSASLTGTQVSRIALPLVAIETLRSGPFAVTVLSALTTLPFLLFGLTAGVWVDRSSPRKVMILSDIGRAVAMLSVPLCLVLTGNAALAWLCLVAAVVGTLTVFFDVAYGSFVPSLVPPDQLEAANGRLTLSDTLSRLVGPGIAGVLVQAVGAALAVVVDGVSYVASVTALASIPGSRPAAPAGRRGGWRQAREGLSHVLGQRVLRALLLTGTTLSFFDAGISALLLLLLTRTVGLSALQIGVAFALGAGGGLLGAASPRLAGAGTATAMIVALLTITGARLLQAFLPAGHHVLAFGLLVLAQVLAGYGAVSFNVVQVSLRQRLTPPALLGRMTATMRMAFWGALPVGAMMAGWLATSWSVRVAAIVAAAGTLLAPLLLAAVVRARSIDVDSVDGATDSDARSGVDADVGADQEQAPAPR